MMRQVARKAAGPGLPCFNFRLQGLGKSVYVGVWKLAAVSQMGGSKNVGPKYSTLNSRILILRTPKKVPLIFGNFQIHKTESGATPWRRPYTPRLSILGVSEN